MIINVPLNKLHLSDLNVRKTERDADIQGLADDIAARGLKQNLVAVEVKEFKGTYEVVAGGRRLQALKLLVERKALAKSHPIPVLVEPREEGHETSLAENLHRVAMNPADEFEAFATVIANYETDALSDPAERIANCARRFGVTVRHVEQRLRLADLAPEILDALRAGSITLDAAKAYAAYPDHKLQMKIFAAEEKKPEDWRHSAKAIRETMKGRVYRLDHAAVIYVGLNAYRAAGGRVERELFMGAEDQDVLLDTALLDRLCRERATKEAQELAQADGWLDGVVKAWNGPVWQDAPAPKGYARTWRDPADVAEELRGDAVLAFRIAADGSGLEKLDYYFRPQEDTRAQPRYQPETPEQREARYREEAIKLKAARLAVPKFAGTPLEGRAFWPADDWNIPRLADREEGFVLVTVQIRVPTEDVEAKKEEAAEILERERVEAEARKAAAAEASDEATPPQDAGDFEDEDDDEELAA